MLSSIVVMRSNNEDMLTSMSRILEDEENDDASMKTIYDAKWIRPASSVQNVTYK
jgi:hypothetical protein